MTALTNADGAAVTIQSCTGDAVQQWTFSGGSVQIFDTKCLDVAGGNTTNGVQLQIWTCMTGDVNQQFYYTEDFRSVVISLIFVVRYLTGFRRLSWTNRSEC